MHGGKITIGRGRRVNLFFFLKNEQTKNNDKRGEKVMYFYSHEYPKKDRDDLIGKYVITTIGNTVRNFKRQGVFFKKIHNAYEQKSDFTCLGNGINVIYYQIEHEGWHVRQQYIEKEKELEVFDELNFTAKVLLYMKRKSYYTTTLVGGYDFINIAYKIDRNGVIVEADVLEFDSCSFEKFVGREKFRIRKRLIENTK